MLSEKRIKQIEKPIKREYFYTWLMWALPIVLTGWFSLFLWTWFIAYRMEKEVNRVIKIEEYKLRHPHEKTTFASLQELEEHLDEARKELGLKPKRRRS